jgi:16S rRNA processing protein RimM
LTPFSDLVAIGRLVRPQGRRGEVVAEVLSDRPDRFPSLTHAFVQGAGGWPREIQVTRSWPHKGRYVLKIEGVDSIDAAEAYRGLEIRLPEGELAALPEGAYYHHELVGLEVRDTAGRRLGKVSDILETGAEAKVLVVKGEAGEQLYPLAASFVKRVDRGAGVLVIEPQEIVDAED